MIDFDLLWDHVTKQFQGDLTYSIHGPAHWRRVEQNPILLASRTHADFWVIRLFALFHDAARWDDGTDEGHGARGAELAEHFRGTLFEVTDAQFQLFQEACIFHADGLVSADPTIGTCWDADRLDLGRVGTTPNAKFMSTAFGKEIARAGSIHPFLFG